jgi:hypothetical protein
MIEKKRSLKKKYKILRQIPRIAGSEAGEMD